MISISLVSPDLLGPQLTAPSGRLGHLQGVSGSTQAERGFRDIPLIWASPSTSLWRFTWVSSMGIFLPSGSLSQKSEGKVFPFCESDGKLGGGGGNCLWNCKDFKKGCDSKLGLCLSTRSLQTPHGLLERVGEPLTDLLSHAVSFVAFSYLLKLSVCLISVLVFPLLRGNAPSHADSG